ncbi:hypothetical protein [Nocardia seriolae]|uniref:Secreted protein n=1 Tax=Nocardia seriolae TaxID=37332 RepID=A0A0B8NMR7_9NOCA|nr:hypothetical protein [Nocardia seriolae]APA99253.1 hypothetical protein NS506_05207 [Nocardia seriolae]MTJ63348.1 hypothetical protein [Nocardia seriolae]MTJ76283.1 hypothetical protein [Nocardia seriolae]MTJ88849.1 hypothetical protein [Nocardia seriolae]MTK32831.1 hypothetical protein [Nocardia seriolae]
MKRLAAILTTGATAAIAVPLISVATAQAAPEGSVYFSHDGQNCAITPDGVIGCDGWQMVGVLTVPIGGGTVISIPAPQSIRDAGGIHPSYDLSRPYTQPGGNPDFYQVANDQGPFGPKLSFAGAFCEVSFRGTFRCVARGE